MVSLRTQVHVVGTSKLIGIIRQRFDNTKPAEETINRYIILTLSVNIKFVKACAVNRTSEWYA